MIEENVPQIDIVKSKIIELLGEKAWNKLQYTTKVDIVTSEICLRSFKNYQKGFDFSSVVTPAMKGLEQELRTSFYDGYLAYLESGKYSPSQYAHKVWRGVYPGDIEIAKKKSKILEYDGTTLLYKLDRSVFTVGDFRFVVGATSLSFIRIDNTFEEYCQSSLFKDYTYTRKEYMDWMRQLITDVESLRLLRNDSAHAGKILNQSDAETALNELVKVRKILGLIVCPPWIK